MSSPKSNTTDENTSVTKQENKVMKKERVPLHKRRILSVEKRPGFVRRIVNETLGAIEAYEAAGWTLVRKSSADLSDNSASKASHMSDNILRMVVNRDPMAPCATAVVMEIPEEFYDADQVAKAQLIDAKENNKLDTLQPGQGVADYGTIKRE